MTRMSGKTNDRYEKIEVVLIRRNKNSFILAVDGDEKPVGRSVVSYHSEQDLDRTELGDSLHVEIKSWVLRENGWV